MAKPNNDKRILALESQLKSETKRIASLMERFETVNHDKVRAAVHSTLVEGAFPVAIVDTTEPFAYISQDKVIANISPCNSYDSSTNLSVAATTQGPVMLVTTSNPNLPFLYSDSNVNTSLGANSNAYGVLATDDDGYLQGVLHFYGSGGYISSVISSSLTLFPGLISGFNAGVVNPSAGSAENIGFTLFEHHTSNPIMKGSFALVGQLASVAVNIGTSGFSSGNLSAPIGFSTQGFALQIRSSIDDVNLRGRIFSVNLTFGTNQTSRADVYTTLTTAKLPSFNPAVGITQMAIARRVMKISQSGPVISQGGYGVALSMANIEAISVGPDPTAALSDVNAPPNRKYCASALEGFRVSYAGAAEDYLFRAMTDDANCGLMYCGVMLPISSEGPATLSVEISWGIFFTTNDQRYQLMYGDMTTREVQLCLQIVNQMPLAYCNKIGKEHIEKVLKKVFTKDNLKKVLKGGATAAATIATLI